MLYRKIESLIEEHLKSDSKKILLIDGARQIGKTYIINHVGKKLFENYIEINMIADSLGDRLFENTKTVEDFYLQVSMLAGNKMKNKENTLIFIDEIQAYPHLLTLLKFLSQDNKFTYIASGSLLGVTLSQTTSIPMGSIRKVRMFPLDFEEFLLAMGKEQLVELLRNNSWAALTPLRGMLTELLRQYYFVGGMPEAVKTYVERGDIWEVRSIHSKIIDAYRNDMSKHAPKQQVQRINMVWNSIPSQLARDNKKFIYGALRKGARANDFEIAIQWLVDSGLVHKVHRISKPVVPLKFYEDMASFKLFLLDCGLLGALSETPPEQILIGDNVFEEYKGAFTENYVLQQLKSLPRTFVYYYSNDNSTLEIDFVVQHDAHIIPIEVKAEENLRAKSLRQFVTDNSGLHGVRFSMSDYREQDWLTNVPLWAVRWAF